jgi:hypothetical protein|tara:strand:- start:425 stop:1123 length:699 start_codon:yes stop_codon:yes gene_type:complete
MLKLNELEIITQTQDIYDSFNNFILSSDTKVFGKLLARALLFNSVKNIPGDILEFGVFKGTGMMTFLKLKKYLVPNSGKKVIGFDFFDTDSLLSSLSDQDKEAMSTLFKGRGFSHEESYVKFLEERIKEAGFLEHEYDFVKGDATITSKQYFKERPGLKISLLYLDMDLEEPTYEVLQAAWDRVSSGGLVVFDEYAFHKWSESKGVDRFFKDKEVQIKSLNFIAPSAYVVKK